MVAGDSSARMTTSTGNTIATKHSHLVMRILVGGSKSAHSKFACECDIACGQYHSYAVVGNTFKIANFSYSSLQLCKQVDITISKNQVLQILYYV